MLIRWLLRFTSEWYFLFAYAISRAIPNKLEGVIALVLSILILISLPFLHASKLKNLTFRPLGKFFYRLFMMNFIPTIALLENSLLFYLK